MKKKTNKKFKLFIYCLVWFVCLKLKYFFKAAEVAVNFGTLLNAFNSLSVDWNLYEGLFFFF